MIAIDNNLIEKVKLFNLGKSHIRKDFSFDFTPEIFDYEKEKFDSLLNDDKEKLFTVKISKLDLSYIGNYLPGRLLEMEWAEENAVLLRMVNQPNTTSIYKMLTQVKLGKSIPLRFQDFQLSFMIKIGDLIAWTNTEDKSISDLIANVNSTKEDKDNLWESYPEYIEKISTTSERYISQDFSLENFLFSADRIERYCTAIDDPDSLDFVLTYRNNDILQAIKDGTLKEYLQSSAAVKIKKKSIPFALSLQYPSYLSGNYKFLMKLLYLNSDINNREMFLNELLIALESRKEVKLEDCKNVLKKCIKRQDMESSLLELEERLTKTEMLTAKEKAEALDRPDAKNADELKKRWNEEDLVRYVRTYKSLVGIHTCETITSFVKSMRMINIEEFFVDFERKDNDNATVFLRSLLHPCKYLFEPAEPRNNNSSEAEFNSGSFAQYFCESTWNGKTEILSMEDRDMEKQRRIYDIYLKLNMLLESIHTRFETLPVVYEKISIIMRYLADIEIHALKELVEQESVDVKLFSMDFGMYKLMPENHCYVVEDLKKNKAEAAKREAEIKQKTQKEIFVIINHSIKNLISSVDGSLSRLERRLPSDQDFVYNLLKQAKQGVVIASDLAKAISLSYRSSGEELWHKDLTSSEKKWSVQEIFRDALIASIPHMFYRKYSQYESESMNYFPDVEAMKNAESAWYDLSDTEERLCWIKNNLFLMNLNDSTAENCRIGNEYSTKTHLFVFFNEILLNAIKAISYIDKEKRLLNVDLIYHDECLWVNISNSAKEYCSISGGCGHIVIDNYRNMFNLREFSSEFDEKENLYRLKFTLPFTKETKKGY